MSHCSLIGVYLSWLIYTLHSSLTRPQNVRGSRKRKCSGLDVLLRMIPSAIYTLIYSLLHWRSEFFGGFFCFFFTYLRGTKRHLSALSWSQWQCIVWLWGGKWIVFLPLGYAGTNTRNNVVVAACFHQLHTPIQRSSSPHSYLSSRSCPPFFLRHNDP